MESMNTGLNNEIITTERLRIQAEYQRREREVPSELYAPWQPATTLITDERRRFAVSMLHDCGILPLKGQACLEIGFGSLGWLSDLIGWGASELDLHGIEIDESRARKAHELLPLANLLVGDATALPWVDDSFHLVITSTVFTSILSVAVREMIASEIQRVLKPGGALLFYDFKVNNPNNPNVRKVTAAELKGLFHRLDANIKTVTLAAPICRTVTPINWTLAYLLGRLPFLRTHLLAVLVKPA
jgi:SAM-dependent methyltransferase